MINTLETNLMLVTIIFVAVVIAIIGIKGRSENSKAKKDLALILCAIAFLLVVFAKPLSKGIVNAINRQTEQSVNRLFSELGI